MRNKPWLALSLALALAYLAYIVWAKFAPVLGPPPVRLGETGEFLLFFASIVAFTLQVIVDEPRGKPSEHEQ